MSGPKRNPDKINTIGVVVVGICGAVLVYVTIVALEAFYVNDTSEIQTMADYGGQDVTAKSVKADQLSHLSEYGANTGGSPQTYHVKIDRAMQKVLDDVKVDPAKLVPAFGRSDKSTIDPVFGRPKIVTPAAGGTPPPATPTLVPNPEPQPEQGSSTGAGSSAGSAVPPPPVTPVPANPHPSPAPPPATPATRPATPPATNPARPRPTPGAGSGAAPRGTGSGGHAP